MIRDGLAGVVVNAIFDAFTPARAYQHYHGGVRILSETASARLATPMDVPRESVRGGRGYDAASAAGTSHASGRAASGGCRTSSTTWRRPRGAADECGAQPRYWLENFHAINRRAVERWPEWPAAWVIPAEQPNRAGPAVRAADPHDGGRRGPPRVEPPSTAAGQDVPGGELRDPHEPAIRVLRADDAGGAGVPGPAGVPRRPAARPYDVTAHTLPLLMNVEAVAVDRRPRRRRRCPSPSPWSATSPSSCRPR
jgi:hypothetical protein